MSLEIDIYPPVNGNQYVVLYGRLDTHTYEQLDDTLEPLLASAKPTMVLVMELARLEYISSAGIRSILQARKALAPGGKVFTQSTTPEYESFDESRRMTDGKSAGFAVLTPSGPDAGSA